MAAKSNSNLDAWVWDTSQAVYYQASSSTYAIPDPSTGEWRYVSSTEFYPAESSTAGAEKESSNSRYSTGNINGHGDGKEEGEIEDDVGWGGLMEPERLAAVVNGGGGGRESASTAARKTMTTTKEESTKREKHPAYGGGGGGGYDDPEIYAYPRSEVESADTSKAPSMPDHLLRLMVTRSESLTVGQVAVIDARADGIQIGRDRCEKGAQARIRVKEMEASKTHAVIYWGKGSSWSGNDKSERERGLKNEGGTEVEGWWVVDLGSTHGTFVTHPTNSDINDNTSSESTDKAKRLSKPKHASKPYPLQHLSRITIASSTFTTHIHPSWPCDQCQLRGDNEIHLDTGDIVSSKSKPESAAVGIGAAGPAINWAMDSKEKRENRESKRKREMASLRENLLNRSHPPKVSSPFPVNGPSSTSTHNSPSASQIIIPTTTTTYLDRSAMRRRLHPPSPPSHHNNSSSNGNSNSNSNRERARQGTPTSTSATNTPPPFSHQQQLQQPAGISSVAQNMLTSQGWTPGQGLGVGGGGRSEPIVGEMRDGRKGLGAKGSLAVVDVGPGDWRDRGKYRRWENEGGPAPSTGSGTGAGIGPA